MLPDLPRGKGLQMSVDAAKLPLPGARAEAVFLGSVVCALYVCEMSASLFGTNSTGIMTI